VLLTGEEEFATWLTATAEKAFGLLRPSDPERMHIVQSNLEKEYMGESVGREVCPPGEPIRPPAAHDTRQADLFNEF
jgi:hypothetical protein